MYKCISKHLIYILYFHDWIHLPVSPPENLIQIGTNFKEFSAASFVVLIFTVLPTWDTTKWPELHAVRRMYRFAPKPSKTLSSLEQIPAWCVSVMTEAHLRYYIKLYFPQWLLTLHATTQNWFTLKSSGKHSFQNRKWDLEVPIEEQKGPAMWKLNFRLQQTQLHLETTQRIKMC